MKSKNCIYRFSVYLIAFFGTYCTESYAILPPTPQVKVFLFQGEKSLQSESITVLNFDANNASEYEENYFNGICLQGECSAYSDSTMTFFIVEKPVLSNAAWNKLGYEECKSFVCEPTTEGYRAYLNNMSTYATKEISIIIPPKTDTVKLDIDSGEIEITPLTPTYSLTPGFTRNLSEKLYVLAQQADVYYDCTNQCELNATDPIDFSVSNQKIPAKHEWLEEWNKANYDCVITFPDSSIGYDKCKPTEREYQSFLSAIADNIENRFRYKLPAMPESIDEFTYDYHFSMDFEERNIRHIQKTNKKTGFRDFIYEREKDSLVDGIDGKTDARDQVVILPSEQVDRKSTSILLIILFGCISSGAVMYYAVKRKKK